jgi:hypothetical protein
MKTAFTKPALALGIVALAAIAMTSSSCKKDKTCHGTVHVIDTAGAPVAGATVLLDAASAGGEVSYTGTTDGSGDATFEVALPAIFDVTATKATIPGQGIGVLRLDEPGKEDTETVTIQN